MKLGFTAWTIFILMTLSYLAWKLPLVSENSELLISYFWTLVHFGFGSAMGYLIWERNYAVIQAFIFSGIIVAVEVLLFCACLSFSKDSFGPSTPVVIFRVFLPLLGSINLILSFLGRKSVPDRFWKALTIVPLLYLLPKKLFFS